MGTLGVPLSPLAISYVSLYWKVLAKSLSYRDRELLTVSLVLGRGYMPAARPRWDLNDSGSPTHSRYPVPRSALLTNFILPTTKLKSTEIEARLRKKVLHFLHSETVQQDCAPTLCPGRHELHDTLVTHQQSTALRVRPKFDGIRGLQRKMQ